MGALFDFNIFDDNIFDAPAVCAATLSATDVTDVAALSANAEVGVVVMALEGPDVAALAMDHKKMFDCDIFDPAIFDCAGPLVAAEADLAAAEAVDSAAIALAGETVEEELFGSVVRLLWSLPAHAGLYAVEAQDTARIRATVRTPAIMAAVEAQDTASVVTVFDYTDDEIVMALMSAAWADDEILV